MTIKEALGLHEDAAILLAHTLKKNTAYLLANPDKKLSPLQATSYKLLIRKRANHWPVAYLVGHKEFFGLDFKVNQDVLIPRPETELLVELALKFLSPSPQSSPVKGEEGIFLLPSREKVPKGRMRGWRDRMVIDVGTGSGNIIISIAQNLHRYAGLDQHTNQLFTIDSSAKALQIAKYNARKHGVAKKIKFLRGNLLHPFFSPMLRGRLRGGSLIIANLPYGWKEWKNNTSAETAGLKFEPQQALFTKEGGLYHIRRLLQQLQQIFPSPGEGRVPAGREGFTLFLEFDPRQKQKIKGLVESYFPNGKIKFHKDLSGRWRVLQDEIPMLY